MERRFLALACVLWGGCAASVESSGAKPQQAEAPAGITLQSSVAAVTRAEDALPGVFIPPFDACKDGVCTHVAISGCTEPGKYFPDEAACDVVRTQRPFWEEPPAALPRDDDPRLQDPNFMRELAWMTEQVEASACTCCHDSHTNDGKTGQWDIRRGPIWLDTLSDSGLALFIGLADSSALGAYPAADNHGFDRDATGIPTTDTARMQAFLSAELARRGISEEEARAVPPFGGPIYANRSMPTLECSGGVGIDPSGVVQLGAAKVRYVYVQADGAQNPGVPPNQDHPDGVLWRLDVLASAEAVTGELRYGETPKGSFQALPSSGRAPALQAGTRYKLYALQDVGVPVINCSFEFGQPLSQAAAAAPPAAASCTDAFGTDCYTDADCKCEAANYCAIMPGQSRGYCTATGCKSNPSVCPSGWSCFDLSAFGTGLPALCMKP